MWVGIVPSMLIFSMDLTLGDFPRPYVGIVQLSERRPRYVQRRSGFFSVALKSFEILAYKYVTFPELPRLVKIQARSIIALYTLQALFDTLVRIF